MLSLSVINGIVAQIDKENNLYIIIIDKLPNLS